MGRGLELTKRDVPLKALRGSVVRKGPIEFTDSLERSFGGWGNCDDRSGIRRISGPYTLRGMLEEEYRRCCEVLAALVSQGLDRCKGEIKTNKLRIAYLERLLRVEVEDDGTPTNQRTRLKMLRERAADVLENEEATDRWMRKPCKALGERWPIDVGKTAEGFEEGSRILGRIECRVYS